MCCTKLKWPQKLNNIFLRLNINLYSGKRICFDILLNKTFSIQIITLLNFGKKEPEAEVDLSLSSLLARRYWPVAKQILRHNHYGLSTCRIGVVVCYNCNQSLPFYLLFITCKKLNKKLLMNYTKLTQPKYFIYINSFIIEYRSHSDVNLFF